jgi:DNA-binding transcriptional ArsR family regulator
MILNRGLGSLRVDITVLYYQLPLPTLLSSTNKKFLMMDSIYLKRVLWYILAGMRGGVTRIKILKLILERPYNMNQLGKKLGLDYKTIQHHIKVLEENKIIVPMQKKYGTIYFPSQLLEKNIHIFEEIVNKIKKE